METSPSLCFLQPGPQTAWGQLGPLQLPGTEKCKGLNKNYIEYLETIGYHILWSLANNSLLLFFFLPMPEKKSKISNWKFPSTLHSGMKRYEIKKN